MAYDLVVIWKSGEQTCYPYFTEEEAKRDLKSMTKILGNRISSIFTKRAY